MKISFICTLYKIQVDGHLNQPLKRALQTVRSLVDFSIAVSSVYSLVHVVEQFVRHGNAAMLSRLSSSPPPNQTRCTFCHGFSKKDRDWQNLLLQQSSPVSLSTAKRCYEPR